MRRRGERGDRDNLISIINAQSWGLWGKEHGISNTRAVLVYEGKIAITLKGIK